MHVDKSDDNGQNSYKNMEGMSGVGVTWEVATEGGVRANSLRKDLSCGSSGDAFVWGRYTVAFVANGT